MFKKLIYTPIEKDKLDSIDKEKLNKIRKLYRLLCSFRNKLNKEVKTIKNISTSHEIFTMYLQNLLTSTLWNLMPVYILQEVRKNNITYKDIYYFSDTSEDEQLKILRIENFIKRFICLFVFYIKKFYYTNSFIKKIKTTINIVEKNINNSNVDAIVRSNACIIETRNLFVNKLLDFYNSNDVLTKKDLKQIYKSILTETQDESKLMSSLRERAKFYADTTR